MEVLNNYIPQSSPVFQQLLQIAKKSQLVVFSGLPGVGKSLYIREFKLIAKSLDIELDVIQWDVARKAFETSFIAKHFPMGEGTVHEGVKLMAGHWLMDELRLWYDTYNDSARILLIEAPLVGHRFIELVKPVDDSELESFLSSDRTTVVMPIPSIEVRSKIETERKRQVKEDAKVWSGAKPSVMLMLWKMTCTIANEFGKNIDLSSQPKYDPEIYAFVFKKILKHRNFVPLIIDEVFGIPESDEASLHDDTSFKADEATANHYAQMVLENYDDLALEKITKSWYIN